MSDHDDFSHELSVGLDAVKMEILAEAYRLLKAGLRISHDDMRTVFAEWNRGELADPLVSATAEVLGLRDEDGEPLVEKVLDRRTRPPACARSVSIALELGVPAPMHAGTAAAALLSSMKDERIDAGALLGGPKAAPTGERKAMLEELKRGVTAAWLTAYAEAFLILDRASRRGKEGFDGKAAAEAWREGGPQSSILGRVEEAYARDPEIDCLILDAWFKSSLDRCLPALRRLCVQSAETGIALPAMSAALGFYDGYRSTWLPANLVLALEDSRAKTGFERVDRPRGEIFHSTWR